MKSVEMISGTMSDSMEAVAAAFAENFDLRDEVGASLHVIKDGESVLDLWGGHKDEARTEPWQEDTISIVFSCTKAITALCAHLLVDRGLLDLNAPVSKYWPEYAANGKEGTTVLMFLNHAAGVPAFTDPLKDGAYCDWSYMIAQLERQRPWWEPGTRNGYHMISFGWTVGELVRRVSGKSLGTFFREEIADKVSADMWIGLPEAEESRVAPMIPFVPPENAPVSRFIATLATDPTSIQHLSLLNSGNFDFNGRAAHAAEIGGGGGIGNARGMARAFTTLRGEDALFSPDRVTAMGEVSVATREDATLLVPTRFAQGFMKSMDNRSQPLGHLNSVILGRNAFGHVGMGGSLVFFDPDCDLIFAYSMNRMGDGLLLNARGQSLVDATYEALGYRSNASGVWTM